jgi:predicted GNAT family acetyltransferase
MTADEPVDEGATVRDNPASDRFELSLDGETAFLEYERTGDAIRFKHTEVPVAFRGRGFGRQLVKGAIDLAHAEQLRIIPLCPFVRAYMDKHGIEAAPRD